MSATGLSVCCLTNDQPAQVAEMLRSYREVADEIVVAVDSRLDPSSLAPLFAVADDVLRFEYRDSPERARPWLVAQCRHESVLMVDGDEVPSGALLAALPELVADGTVAQFRIARRWCFPDGGHWLAERPWWPDYQRRLLRRGPELDFECVIHGGVRAAGPARYADEPLYHLACVLAPFAERRERVRRYEAARPGLVAVGGGPMNDTLYVPEHFATLPLAVVPDDDRLRIDAVMAAASRDDVDAPPIDVPIASADVIDAYHPADPLAAQGYRATLQVVERDRRTEPGNDTLFVVAVGNEGDTSIPHRDSPGAQVRVATRLLDRETTEPVGPWAMSALPCDVPPGQSRLVETLVQIPREPGAFLLEVGLVNERSRWFGCTTRAEILVAGRWGRYAR